MLCSSLVHRGDELLHLRAGIDAYAERGKTCGIPFLHPWANRLSGDRYEAGGKVVELSDRGRPISRDAGGLPSHGLLGGRSAWTIVQRDSSALTARFEFSTPDLLANFPFPHQVILQAVAGDDALTIATTILPTSPAPVPVSFGYHPYLRIPGVAREQWIVALPVRRRLLLDSRSIPTGDSESVEFARAPLGTRSFDDGFTDIAPPRRFTIEGGGRSIAVDFDEGYPYAQIFAPAGSDFLCVEPMTAPTNALVRGGGELPMATEQAPFRATFKILVDP